MLYRTLHNLKFHEVMIALKTFDKRDIAIAALLRRAGYITLTFYDLFALRTIGRPNVPYRIAALAGFTSYSIGHNVGASVFTGGAVRYRIYSHHGLSAVDVAKLCFIAGLTFWLGNATVLGLGILYAPQAASAIDQMPPWINRGIAVAILSVLASYLVWVWRAPRKIGNKSWEVTLPRGPLTLLQIVIGIIDLACCAFAMYMLVPADPHIGFIELSVIFVSATLLGFASHSPGGLGVFDAAMLVALWQYDKEELFAGLVAVPAALLHHALRAGACAAGPARTVAQRDAQVAAADPGSAQASDARACQNQMSGSAPWRPAVAAPVAGG